MDTQSSSRVFQLLLLLVCRIVIQITDCLKLNATNGLTFSPNTTAKFECEINPYTDGIQEWSVNTIVVAECGFILCDVKNNNQGSYSFTNDINTGMFTFTIYPLTLADDGTVVGCSDGTITEQRTITVTETITTTKAITPSQPDIKNTTTGSGKNHLTTHTTLSSMSTLRQSTLVSSVPKRHKRQISSYTVHYIALACFVVISVAVLTFYCFQLRRK